MTAPTAHEKNIANIRRGVAIEQRDRLKIARTVCGRAKRYARWVLIDRLALLPDRVFYCADHGDGKGWIPPCPSDRTRTDGNLFRWKHCFDFIGVEGRAYKPKNAKQLATARAGRENKALEKLAADMPLFAEDIRAKNFKPATHPARYLPRRRRGKT